MVYEFVSVWCIVWCVYVYGVCGVCDSGVCEGMECVCEVYMCQCVVYVWCVCVVYYE